ncbi:MAG: T9SS type A sorting domain-containing protein [Saprospiraceae bacterium]|nr:T9SS type A sorting domain-containing protein [Saprospiraceae bacterium]
MKNIIIVFVVCLLALVGHAQEMRWIPSKYIKQQQDVDVTNCEENLVCYTLQYIPNHTGMLTSYTTGFVMDCDEGFNAVKLNSSNSLNDHSQEIIGCEQFGKIMMHCSGNDGKLNVEKGVPVYLHQICIQTQNKTNDLMIRKSELAGLTASLNLDNNTPITEFISYRPYQVLNNFVHCEQTSNNLKLDAELTEGSNARLIWKPTKEETDGIYEIYQSFENGSFDVIKFVPSKVLTQQISEKYTLDVDLQEFGKYTFKVVYKYNDGSSFTSNLAKVDFLDENFSFALQVSPNPTSQFVNVEVTSEEEIVSMNLLDTDGKLIKQIQLISNKINTIDLENLPAGIYSIVAFTGEEVITERIILIE